MKTDETPKFGTSGLRGLVAQLTPDCVGRHVAAFVASCETGNGIYVGHDLRPSSAKIAQMVADAAGKRVIMCGAVPTPALALAAMGRGCGAVMVTGSHIPADRNGLKFYTPSGEITKIDEARIREGTGTSQPKPATEIILDKTVGQAYAKRYLNAFGTALTGLRIGLYAQSAVGRDIMADLLRDMGASLTELGRAETFVPVDTEAVPDDVRARLRGWAANNDFDAIISTDADGDRPLVADAEGHIVVGDVLGQITGQMLGATCAVTPVSSNTGAEAVFDVVARTRIGSPYVIAEMEARSGAVVGYEANGGFLLGFDAKGPSGELPALMTRDAVLPIVATLVAAKNSGLQVTRAAMPSRFTASDRLVGIPTDKSRAFLSELSGSAARRAELLASFDLVETGLDETDGLRMTTATGRILHLRPSGNAPEFRVYTEASTQREADQLLRAALNELNKRLSAT